MLEPFKIEKTPAYGAAFVIYNNQIAILNY